MSELSAERTPRHNPGIRHGADRRRDILTALLAANREVALPAFREVEHERQYRRIEGESSTKPTCESLGSYLDGS